MEVEVEVEVDVDRVLRRHNRTSSTQALDPSSVEVAAWGRNNPDPDPDRTRKPPWTHDRIPWTPPHDTRAT